MKTFRRFLLIAVTIGLALGAAFHSAPAAADNDTITVGMPLATSTTSVTGTTLINSTHRGVRLYLYVSAVVGGGSVAAKVQTKDPVSGNWVDITSATTEARTTSTVEFALYPGIAETSNVSVSDVLPKYWRVYATVVTSATFSVGAAYID